MDRQYVLEALLSKRDEPKDTRRYGSLLDKWVCQEKCVSFIKFPYRQFSKLPVFHSRINIVHT